jgi:branched-chain amino acid transport system substrate-binding protein
MKRRRYLVGSTLLALALVASACGNDTKSSSSTTTTSSGSNVTTATTAKNQFADLKEIAAPSPCVNGTGVTDSEIKVGMISTLTGPGAASFATSVKGVQAWIDKANGDGSLGKRKITLIQQDDAGDAAKNLQAARQLVESDHVFAVIEISIAAAGSADYLHQNNVPVVGWHVGVPAWSIDTNMFTFRSGTAADPVHEFTSRNVAVLQKLGATKVAFVAGGSAASADFVNRIGASLAQDGNGPKEVYKNTSIPLGSTDFTATIQRIKESGADAVVTGMDFLPNTALSQQLQAAGVKLKAIIFPGGYSPLVLHLPGIEGASFSLEFKPLEENTPDAVAFKKALPTPGDEGQIQYIGWLSGELLSRGIEAAGVDCPTQKAFINNLRLVKDYTANGAFDAVDFTTHYGHEFLCAYYVKVQDAKFVPLFGGNQVCGHTIAIQREN